jgi:2-polyprenyl-6-methoxyphenol hydroxylase-like FAD-dependent oxidoreductase
MSSFDTQVLIVGGGPVGLTVALELARHGVRCILVNDQRETALHPKANAINARSMEHFRRHGISTKIRAAGLPADYPTDVTYVTRLTGFEMARLSMPTSSDAVDQAKAGSGPYDCAEPPHRCNQMYLEAILHEATVAHALIDVRFGHRLEAFGDVDGGVIATVRNLANDQVYDVCADYLVGADGGRSYVRRQLGVRYEGEGGVVRQMMGGAMLATYFRAPRDRTWLQIAPSWQYWIVSPDLRALLLSVDGGDQFVLLSRIPDGADVDTIDDVELISRAAGVPVEAEIILRQPWTAGHALLAQSFGRDRVWLAGDAAHLFTPTGGLGMNTGIDDGVNLAWKLAAAVNGWGGPNLIATYETDRRPIGERNLAFAKSFAESIGTFDVSAEVERGSAAGQTERQRLGAHLADHGWREFIIPGIVLGVRYEGSPIIWPDGTPPTSDDPYNYIPTARPGSRAPHVWLDDGSALCDHFGAGFTLLRLAMDTPVDDLLLAAHERGVPVIVFAPGSDVVRERYEADLALVGPDGHVVWRGNETPTDCGALIDRIRGA